MRRPTLVRYAGLAGSGLLAVAAYFGGARSPRRPTITLHSIVIGQHRPLVPSVWLLGIILLISAWWVGRNTVPSARWAYVTAALWAVPLVPFLPLGSYDAYSYACQGWQQAVGLDPYSGGVDLLGCPWANAIAPTWLDSPAPYGPVFLVLAATAVKLGGSLTGTIALLRVVAVLGVGLVAVCLPALARLTGVPLRRVVWLSLACPLVPIHLISGVHNDAIMVGLLVAGLTCATSRRWWLAGLLLGLAIGVKATAVVAVPFAFLLGAQAEPSGRGEQPRSLPPSGGPQRSLTSSAWVRELMAGGWRERRWRPAAEVLGGVVGSLTAVSLLSGRGFGWVTGLAGSGVSVQWTAPATAVGMTLKLFGADAINTTRMVGIAILVVVLVVLWRRARLDNPLQYTALALAATVVLAPVFHPWYATWPLAMLAVTVQLPTRWLVVPFAGAAALCLPDGYNLALASKAQGAIGMTVFIAYLTGKALYEAKNPDRRRAGAEHRSDRLPSLDA